MLKNFTLLIEQGSVSPVVKMDNNVIVEGNHRIVAGVLCDQISPIAQGVVPHPNLIG
ncbi:hypothetical protein [Rodentibacter caecimuris]|uniref:hypothetical protein n=1 Tax=Rodentibacter caecimuris TaxID=1796644 RepID=UPI001441E5B7|nr:hypothetical protein [Pasteurella caecimuris]